MLPPPSPAPAALHPQSSNQGSSQRWCCVPCPACRRPLPVESRWLSGRRAGAASPPATSFGAYTARRERPTGQPRRPPRRSRGPSRPAAVSWRAVGLSGGRSAVDPCRAVPCRVVWCVDCACFRSAPTGGRSGGRGSKVDRRRPPPTAARCQRRQRGPRRADRQPSADHGHEVGSLYALKNPLNIT